MCISSSYQGPPGVRGEQGPPVSTVIVPLREKMYPGGDLNCFHREPRVRKESQERD